MDEIKLVCLDLDETIIGHNSWFDLGIALGMTPEEDERLYDLYKAGTITYEEWNGHVLAHYLKHEDANRQGVTKILSSYTFNDGAREAVEYLKAQKYEIVLISGSIDIIVDNVARDLGIQYRKANNAFEFDEHDRLKYIRSYGNDTLAKLAHLESFCEMLGIQIEECACIGDGANDIAMFRKTTHGITFANSPIKDEAWKIIDSLHDIQKIL